jgi:hypothetical protein
MYKQIIPAHGWYFRHENTPGAKRDFTIYQLAAWGLNESGEVIGLVAANFPDRQPPTLLSVPPVSGQYLHVEQLNDSEVEAAKER